MLRLEFSEWGTASKKGAISASNGSPFSRTI
jgi:hypothetical protein